MLINKIFFEWVSKELQLFLLITLLIPLGLSSGIVGSASVYMTGSLSAIPADITMASYAHTIGLVLGVPFILSFKQIITSKHLLLGVFGGLAGVDIILGLTDQPLILVMGSFVAGFLKIIGLLEIFATLIPILMPKGERYRLYAVYYPVTLISSQLLTMAVVFAADRYSWQIGQVSLIVPLLLGMILILIFVHPFFPGETIPLYTFDWLGLMLTTISMLLLDYVLSYGLTEDWLKSSKIILAIVFSLLSLTLLITRTFIVQKPFLDFSVMRYKNVWFGLIVMFILSIFFAGSSIQNNMMNIILKGNQVEITRINLYMIPGFIVATLIGYCYYNKYNGFKIIIIIVAVCYTVSFIQLYFLTTLSTTSQDFYLPVFLRGVAGLLSYMAVGIYVANGVPFLEFFSVIFYYLAIRLFYGPAIWNSLLSYIYYHRMVYNIDVLASKIDRIDPLYLQTYSPVYNRAVSAGNGLDQAVNLGTKSVFSNVQAQASLLSSREIFGAIIIVGILFIVALLLIKIYQTTNSTQNDGFTLL